MSIAMRGIGSAQVAAAAAEYLPSGQTRRDGKETWIIDDCLGLMWAVIGGTDDNDAMFKQRIDRCVLISPLLAYEDMDDLLCLMREVCLSTGVEGGPSCGIRVFADLGEGDPAARPRRSGAGRQPKAYQREGRLPGKRAIRVQVLDAQNGARRGRVQAHAQAIPEEAPGGQRHEGAALGRLAWRAVRAL